MAEVASDLDLAVDSAQGELAGVAVGEIARQPRRIWLPIIILGRAVMNVAFRIVYPFLPSIARGLGISLAAASGLVALRVVGGLGAPFFGPLTDRYGRRRMMQVAFLLFTLASLLMVGVGTLAAAAVVFLLYGLARALYDPAVYGYVGDNVPYQERGRTVGIVELSWSGAWLLGVPASGFLIERFGWRAPWAVLFVLGLLCVWIVRVGLSPTRGTTVRSGDRPLVASMIATWRNMLRLPSVAIFLLISLLLVLAIEVPFIVYGAWLETEFGMSITTLGLASVILGLAEATAEIGAAVVVDRLGKRRSVLMGIVGMVAGLVLLPWLSGFGAAAALTGVALVFLTFEFGMVALMPLATELVPDARSSLFSLTVAVFALGRIIGALVGGWLWQWQSIALHAGVGAVFALGATLLLAWGLRGIE